MLVMRSVGKWALMTVVMIVGLRILGHHDTGDMVFSVAFGLLYGMLDYVRSRRRNHADETDATRKSTPDT